MGRLTRDETAEPVSRDQILRHARGQGNIHFLCSADHEEDWQPYLVDPYSAICDDHTYIHTRELSVETPRCSTLDRFNAPEGGGFRVEIETHVTLEPLFCTRVMFNNFKRLS